MRKVLGRVGTGAVLVVGFLVTTAYAAMAAVDTTASDAVDAGAVTLKDTLIDIAVTVLPYAAAILAIVFGWMPSFRRSGAGEACDRPGAALTACGVTARPYRICPIVHSPFPRKERTRKPWDEAAKALIAREILHD